MNSLTPAKVPGFTLLKGYDSFAVKGRGEGLPIRGVTERLRGLSPPLKYSAYVVGAFLMLFAAVAMGAAAAFVVGVGGG
jgi:hypothetical protein